MAKKIYEAPKKVKKWSNKRKFLQKGFLKTLQLLFEVVIYYAVCLTIGSYVVPIVSSSIGSVVLSDSSDIPSMFSLWMLPSFFLTCVLLAAVFCFVYKFHKFLNKAVDKALVAKWERNEDLVEEQEAEKKSKHN